MLLNNNVIFHNRYYMASQPRIAGSQKKQTNFPKRLKRFKSYWDPLFNPRFIGLTNEFDWNTSQKTGIKKSLCTSDKLKISMEKLDVRGWTVKGFSFIECDFYGTFVPLLSFNSCKFLLCDMGSTTWRGVKFSNCDFTRCSFTMATFEQCIFHNCTWSEIGISGTETKLFDTIITNPESFISAGYTNLNEDELKQYGSATPDYQILRLEESKVKLARAVLSNNERNAEDSAYYESIKIYLKQSILAKISKAKSEKKQKKNIIKNSVSQTLGLIEKGVISLSWWINGWGGNISRAAICGVSLILIFSMLYTFNIFGLIPSITWKLALIKSFDITLLIGYTKHATSAQTWQEQTFYGINALLGLWWYAIFVPTVINRICRVR